MSGIISRHTSPAKALKFLRVAPQNADATRSLPFVSIQQSNSEMSENSVFRAVKLSVDSNAPWLHVIATRDCLTPFLNFEKQFSSSQEKSWSFNPLPCEMFRILLRSLQKVLSHRACARQGHVTALLTEERA